MIVKGRCTGCGSVFQLDAPETKTVTETVTVHATPEASAEQWAEDCQVVTLALANLLVLTHGYYRSMALAEMARTFTTEFSGGGLFIHCLKMAVDGSRDREARGCLSAAMERYKNMPPERQDLIRASIHGVLLGWNLAREHP